MAEPMLLKVLRILSWPYRFPPLSWIAAGIDWLAATSRRFWTFLALVSVAQVTMVVIICVR